MKNLSYKQYRRFCQAAHLEPNQNLYQHLNQEWMILQQRLDALKTINVTNIEPLTRISPPIDFNDLRLDQIQTKTYLTKDYLLANAKASDQDFVIIKRII